METSLSVEPRQDTGKGVARKLRAAGRIPAVIYADGKEARHGAVDPARLQEIFRKSQNRNTVVQLEIDGATVPALVKEAQRHPVSRALLHVDFLTVRADKPVEVMVPIRGVGRPAGAAVGGKLEVYRRKLRVRCAYDRIPETLDVDVTPLEVGGTVKASEVPTPEGVEVVFDHDFKVLGVVGKRK